MRTEKQDRTAYIFAFFLILSISFSNYYLEVGFALKPFMLISMVIFLIYFKVFSIHKLLGYEVLLILFFMLYSFTGLYAEYKDYSLRLILGIILVISCYFVMRFILSKVSIQLIENVIIKSGLIFNVASLTLYALGLITLNFNFMGNRINSFGVLIDRNMPRLNGTFEDPNMFVFYNTMYFFFYLTHLNKRYAKLGLLLSTISIGLTMSRGGIIAILFGLVFVFFKSPLKQKVKLLFIVPIGTFIATYLVKKLFHLDIYQYMVFRFSQNDNGSGRIDIWQNGLNMLIEKPIGIGIFNFQPYYLNEYGKAKVMHNTFLEVLIEGGVLSLALYLLVFLIVIFTLYKYRKKGIDNNYLTFSILSMMITMGSLSLVINEALFIVLALVWRYTAEAKGVIKEKNVVASSVETVKRKKKKKYRIVW